MSRPEVITRSGDLCRSSMSIPARESLNESAVVAVGLFHEANTAPDGAIEVVGSMSTSNVAGIGDSRPMLLAFELTRPRNSGLLVKKLCRLPSMSAPLVEEGFVEELMGFAGSERLWRPRFWLSAFELSIVAARRRGAFTVRLSGLTIHQELLPAPSFCTRMKRL